MSVPSTASTVKLPLLKDVNNFWFIVGVEFFAPDGQTRLQGELSTTGDIGQDRKITGDCTITLVVGSQ